MRNVMPDVIGIIILLLVAAGFRLYLRSRLALAFHYHGVAHGVSFSDISFWVLIFVSALWTAALVFVSLINGSVLWKSS